MKVFEGDIYTQDEHIILGFINAQYEFEYTIYECSYGGTFALDDKKCREEEFTDLLEVELKNFIEKKQSTITIIGHEIRVISLDGTFIKASDLDDEVYEINQSILDGYDSGDIFLESKKIMCLWNIV